MPGIIRNDEHAAVPRPVAFNFEDLAQHAQRYLEAVRVDAARILALATEQAEQLKRRAAAEGRQQAADQARRHAEEHVARQLDSLLPALRAAIDAIAQTRHEWLAEWDRRVVRLAAAMAARILRRELDRHPELPAKLVREALEMITEAGTIRIHLNPQDLQALGSHSQRLAAEFARLGSLEFVPDAQVAPGGCRVETRFGLIDQQIESQLARLAEELT